MKQKLLLTAFAALLASNVAWAQSTSDDDLYEVQITADNACASSYTLNGSTDYTYLVIVPAKPFQTDGKGYSYGISDGTNKVGGKWGFAYGGQRLKHDIDTLPQGLYIVDGEKIAKR